MEEIQKNMGRLQIREEQLKKVRAFTLMSDVFMSVALHDKAACQHVIRILTGKKDLTVKAVRPQYRISRLISHDAILDILAEDEEKHLYNLEIQRQDTVDHSRRTRFYGAMIDSEYLEKGKGYEELPDIHIIYISEKDLWKAGHTVYPVKKYLGGEKIPYDDGMNVVYINTAVDDGSETAALMKYFRTADPDDRSQGALSDRVRFLKCEEGGQKIMCEITEKIYNEGLTEGEARGREKEAQKTAMNLAGKGFSVEAISEIIEVSSETVKQWLDRGNRVPG